MLDGTPKTICERKALRINPAKTCQPVGAMYAALGVHRCMPHSHGSQGCCSYHRSVLTRHFKDPVMATTSSFTESASVFGGGSNLKTAVKNIFAIYDPDIIAVHTTCLSETIGDDIRSYISEMDIPEGKFIVHANTPSYVGSHITGYSNMICGFINYLSKSAGAKNGKAALIPGFVNPGDMRELKRIASLLGLKFTMLPDTSGVLDAPMTGKFEMYPKGGTRIPDIIGLGDCDFSLGLGEFATAAGVSLLNKKCKVDGSVIGLPIGIEATDKFVMEIVKRIKCEVPYELEEERGQLVDMLIDSHPYFSNKKIAIFGDPDTVIGLADFTASIGMIPRFCYTGTPGELFSRRMDEIFKKYNIDGIAKPSADLFELHQMIKNEKVDLLMGGTYGKFIARAEDLPFVRIGFPVLDRYIHSYLPVVGYRGAVRVLEMILNALMDRIDRDAADEDLELVM